MIHAPPDIGDLRAAFLTDFILPYGFRQLSGAGSFFGGGEQSFRAGFPPEREFRTQGHLHCRGGERLVTSTTGATSSSPASRSRSPHTRIGDSPSHESSGRWPRGRRSEIVAAAVSSGSDEANSTENTPALDSSPQVGTDSPREQDPDRPSAAASGKRTARTYPVLADILTVLAEYATPERPLSVKQIAEILQERSEAALEAVRKARDGTAAPLPDPSASGKGRTSICRNGQKASLVLEDQYGRVLRQTEAEIVTQVDLDPPPSEDMVYRQLKQMADLLALDSRFPLHLVCLEKKNGTYIPYRDLDESGNN